MLTAMGVRLGIDFGTTSTVAVLRNGAGAVTPLLFDASPLLGSGVFAGPDTEVLTGADAYRAGLAHPGGFEPHPKRRIDEGTVWLGEREIPVLDLIAAVLARVEREARRVVGAAPATVVLTHPATWGRARTDVLGDAARRAGLGEVTLVPEPIAAAAYFSTVLGRELPEGHAVSVYDLGAGTFDTSVLRRHGTGFDTLAAAGLADLGGVDLDHLVVAHARQLTRDAAVDAWGRLDWPRAPDDQRARRTLWDGARAVKEQLSRHAAADLYVPLVDVTVRLTREEFERAAHPLLERSVEVALTTLRRAGVTREALAGLFLVGGSSRVPLVASLLHRTLGLAPTVIEQPELAVATGSLHLGPAGGTAPDPVAAAEPGPRPAATGAGPAEPPERTDPDPPAFRVHRRSPAVAAAAAALVLLMPTDIALGGVLLVKQGPAGMVFLLGVQMVTTIGWASLRTRRIPRPGWGHVVLIVSTTLVAVPAVVLLFRHMGRSTIPPATAVTVAIMLAVGALLPARPRE
ncbi:Hsp70 family protein [Plantactinospora soyae]|uniref:Ethanolamine utilization protein EutJ (Predicted chaperonin) n=1 Tax=Plantactinospora soyae TaxID=1544732 RepID=A0A927M7F3_9ACTN|nr:Hsp70 family protein [Plantactinospora soyae]MBE1489382.1 Ethanolamine utilization protein EutJ (predicted chaperonin) [Plantactinospora soyae]